MPNQLLSLVGRVSLQVSEVNLTIANQKARSILALIALSDHREISRQSLCALLWPESEPHRARASLRQTLRRLRLDLASQAANVISERGDHLQLAQEDIAIDHELILTSVRNGLVPERLMSTQNVVESFLSDLYGITADLDSWIAVQRNRLQSALEDLLAIQLTNNVATELLRDACKALLILDPTNEAACRALMRHYVAVGETAPAIRTYDTLYRVLDEEYDVEPMQETIDLVSDIKLGRKIVSLGSLQTKKPNSVTVRDRPTIRISRFHTSSDRPISNISSAFFQDLLAILIRFREWYVIEDSGSYTAADHYVLQGVESLASDDKPILTIVLKRESNGQFLWSEQLEIARESWTSKHAIIARRLATAINSNISTDRLMRRSDLAPQSQTAFDRWLHCQKLNSVWSPEAGLEIPKLLEAIIEDEPMFAPAHAELAANYNSRHIFFPGLSRKAKFQQKALYHARIALEIDPLETRAQRVMAWTHLMGGEFDHAEFHFRQALDLNVINPFTLVSSAQGLAFCGRTERALELIEAASELQQTLPDFLNGYLVGINFLDGRYEEAVRASRHADGAISNLLGWEASALWHLGRQSEAVQTTERMVARLRPAWIKTEKPTRDNFADWFIDSFPIRDADQRSKLDQGFRAALANVEV